ncbi:hypothetical protein C7444_103182 [Sphaerotilus hippei]|uniref:Copper(I)-binding protein n=1 Tax=Sphaerotilus hippei TaxID=744406 RepID=A0A318H6L5_9BURK|nr:copper chaperone PCu(A)C [Sphaerotilus hippei]PXW98088.1 hypothetical protein C7444_103182 [Sphaerotilus hippei]
MPVLFSNPRRTLIGALALSGLLPCTPALHAHGSRAGEVRIDHPYAVPTPAGASTGAVYFRHLDNRSAHADRLKGGRTPVAARVTVHEMRMDGEVMRMSALPGLDLPAGTGLPMRQGSGRYHLMLEGLKRPLKEGDRFPLVLEFERGGAVEVEVWVQARRAPDSGHAH